MTSASLNHSRNYSRTAPIWIVALMVLALRHGELSVLYPLISLGYVWVAVLSVVVFGEMMNVYKITGICAIMAGVAVLGSGAHK